VTTTVAPSVTLRDRNQSGERVSSLRLMRVALIQHRAALITILVAFIALVVALVIGRDAVNASYASYLAAGCTLAHPIDLSVCVDTANKFADIPSFTPLVIALGLFPLIIGAFVGAPLIAREMELGTYRFAWTQGVGRTRLLLVTLAMLALVVTPVAVALGFLLGGWYIHPYAVINTAVGSHWQSGLFMTTWWMTPVLTLFALALGTFVGAVVKRTVAAIAATVVVVNKSVPPADPRYRCGGDITIDAQLFPARHSQHDRIRRRRAKRKFDCEGLVRRSWRASAREPRCK
jgi:hypothetical protein